MFALAFDGVSLAFEGRAPLFESIHLRLGPGFTGVVGPNGAGKSSLLSLAAGLIQPTSGQILFDGHDITGESSARIARRGVIRSFQISAVFPHLTVLENVRVALQRQLHNSFHFWRSERSLAQLDGRAMELLSEVDC